MGLLRWLLRLLRWLVRRRRGRGLLTVPTEVV